MQFCRVGKKSKRFSPGSDFRPGTLRDGFRWDTETGYNNEWFEKKLETCLYLFSFCKPKFLVGYRLFW